MDFPERLPIPRAVVDIAERLLGAGFETWCVGGAVRDHLLREPNEDFDLATAATPQQVRRLFPRTVPIGIAHGTVAVLDAQDRPHEVTTFRRDVKTDGRHAVVEFGVSLDEDLARRDFTINAIAYHPLQPEWRDPFDGRDDLEAGVIRAVGDPDHRFREDFLRILRALRFSARFGFRIEEHTARAAVRHVTGLRALSAERVRDEWFKGLTTARQVSDFVTAWRELGAAEMWLPELAGGVPADPAAIDRLPRRDPVLVTSYVSRDPGATLDRLRCSRAEIERGRRIGRFRRDLPDAGSERDVRHWLARVGDAADDLIALHRADGGGDALATAVRLARSSGAPLTLRDLAIDGGDLLALGIPGGPAVGVVLGQLLETVLDDPAVNDRERLLARARRLAAEHVTPEGEG